MPHKPERELVGAVDARRAVIPRAVLHQLAGQDVEDRALVADRARQVRGGGGGVAERGQAESKGWRVGAVEVPGERAGRIGSCVGAQHGLDAGRIKQGLYLVDGSGYVSQSGVKWRNGAIT